MRLINTRDLSQFKLFWGTDRPPYAILSHTWDDEEVSLQEMLNPSATIRAKKGYQKIRDFCWLAAEQGYEWAWADTCCIDKANLAELTESINPMFRWYQEAAVCFVYLADLPAAAGLKSGLSSCRWFTRGWTLQELLAPDAVQFYDAGWTLRGTKSGLIQVLVAITGIRHEVLFGFMSLTTISVGTRMSWAAKRETTRPEDIAYCLLGIFNVSMPLLYGEGKQAFRRLQEEIIRQSNDLSVLAWAHPEATDTDDVSATSDSGHLLFAPTPAGFAVHLPEKGNGWLWRPGSKKTCGWIDLSPEYAVTNKGLRVKTTLLILPQGERDWSTGNLAAPAYVLAVGEVWSSHDTSRDTFPDTLVVILDKIGPDFFERRLEPMRRIPSDVMRSPTAIVKTPVMDFYIGTGDGQFRLWNWSSIHGALNTHQGLVPIRSTANDSTSPQAHALIQVGRAIPESHWDRINRRFFRTPHSSLIFGFLYLVRLDSQIVKLVCLVDQSQVFPMVFLFNCAEYPALYLWFLSWKATNQGTFWADIPDSDLLRNPSRERGVIFTAEGKQYSATVMPRPFTHTGQEPERLSYDLRLLITERQTESDGVVTLPT